MGALRGMCHRTLRYISGPPSNPSIIPPAAHLISYRGIASKLFVKGISFSSTEESLSKAFSQFGEVLEAKIIVNKITNRSKGFGYVTFATEDEAQKALMGMNGKLLDGRNIFVDNERPRMRFKYNMPIERGPPEPTADD